MSPERLRAVIQADEDAWNAHDANRLAALMAADMEFVTPSAPHVVHGRDGFREIAERYLRAFPDFRIVNRPIAYAGEDEVVVLWRVTGTHTAPLLMEMAISEQRTVWVEVPASGRSVEVNGSSVIRVSEDGLIARSEEHWDRAGLMPQLGMRPFLIAGARATAGELRRAVRRRTR